VWYAANLDSVDDPGDKGLGLVELRGAQLQIPATVVCSVSEIGSSLSGSEVISDLFKILGVGEGGQVILRPSLRISRESAPSVSGLYDSIEADRISFMQKLDEVWQEYNGPDRQTEFKMLGIEKASSEMYVLVQPLLEPEFSGVAHMFAPSSGPRFRLGIVPGHLSGLVEGRVEGWECELTAVDIGSGSEVAIIADEDDVTALMTDVKLPSVLNRIHGELSLLWQSVRDNREVEWAVQGDSIWFLQSQPLASGKKMGR
jgi:hypothetical protein